MHPYRAKFCSLACLLPLALETNRPYTIRTIIGTRSRLCEGSITWGRRDGTNSGLEKVIEKTSVIEVK